MTWLRARAENVAVIMITVMVLSFLVQIVSRYVLNNPFSWTMELCLTMWLWIVFWGGAFLLEDRDHIRFDVLYLSMSTRVQRVFALVSALALLITLGLSFLPSLDYVTFMKIERSATLGIRLDCVFAVYMIFLAAVILRYAIRALRLLRGEQVDDANNTNLS